VGFYFEGGRSIVVRSVWGNMWVHGALWLGERGGGEDERGPGGSLVGQE
jgi:hypothetical protein